MPLIPRGLVVGKFAPLHRGHQVLLDQAAAECAELYIISYSNPELPGCPPAERARWLAALYPRAHRLVLEDGPPNAAPEDDHRRFVAQVCRARFGTTVDAVFTGEGYGDGFAAVLSDCFGRPVLHRRVDRTDLPVSGTRIRADVHGERHWLSPLVYASFMERVCLLGGESSGKTTLAEALARHHGTAWVPEYGRVLWEERCGHLRREDMLAIARRQIADEEAAAQRAVRWLFCDTSPLTTLFYSRDLFGEADDELVALAERSYAAHVLCAPDFAFVQDGTRREPAFRDRQDAFYRQTLQRWFPATGSVAQRVAAVSVMLGA